MTSVPLTVGLIVFGLAALAYVCVAVLMMLTHPGTRQADWLVGALLVSALWACAYLYEVWSIGALTPWLPGFDAAHTSVWVLFLAASLLASGTSAPIARRVGRGLLLGTTLLAVLVLIAESAGNDQIARIALLFLPLLGLLGLEQVFRNSDFQERWVLTPLAVALGVVFAIDIFVYSQAFLFADISPSLSSVRGIANAAAAPWILLTAKRHPDWERALFISRQVVFYTTSLVAAGLYLIAMGIGGVLIGARQDTWGLLLQVLFLISASAVFLYALFSTTVRARLKVFIAKHFYRNRYDYREEWLRLMRTLAGTQHQVSLSERSVRALADIIGSSCGELWLAQGSKPGFVGAGGLGTPPPTRALAPDDVLVRFLHQSHWVIDTQEYRDDPERYANAFASDERYLEKPSIYVPLVHDSDLVGIVRLDRPAALGNLSFEDHDLLKTVGQQVAIFLVQERAQDELSETRQFEAFSKLTAFLMHDLKNSIAQQELVIGNAHRFRDRPEFISDAIRTIELSVQRMRHVLERLQGASSADRASRVDIGKVLYEVCSACADREPVPVVTTPNIGLQAMIDPDKLHMALTHTVRNAQDATPADGEIELTLDVYGEHAVIEVVDTGVGMDANFIRDDLFKPFRSTKGAKGMGIGAYQVREILRAAGGDVEVSSTVGEGTRVRMNLPLVGPAERLAAQSVA